MMIRKWSGHHTKTQVRLLSLLIEAASGKENFSRDERAFCTACNFWAGVASGTLATIVDVDDVQMLCDARLAFQIVGAKRAAEQIEQTVVARRSAAGNTEIHAIHGRLYEDLWANGDSIDTLLAEFAGTLTRSAKTGAQEY